MAEDRLGVLSSTLDVVEHARLVTIDQAQVAAVAERLGDVAMRPQQWDSKHHFADGTARTANYVLVLDALNFSFWGDPRWRITYQGERLDGYWALAYALKRAILEGVPLLDATYLANITAGDLQNILRGEGQIPLFEERRANLHEVGGVLAKRYGGQFTTMIERAGYNAVGLVLLLALELPSFRDVALYRGRPVRFYKRAQICVADLFGSFGGNGWGRLADLDQLTAFADYKLPQMLRELGILRYDPALSGRIDAFGEILAGSAEEVEIRSATVWAVEYLRRVLAERSASVRAFEVDWYLWDISQRTAGLKPYHRTRTVFY